MKEDPRGLEALCARLWDDLEPVGAMQEELVDIVASCCWRRRRAVRAEVGAIRRAADSTVHDMIDARERRFLLSLNDEDLSGGGMNGSWRDMVKTSLGVQHLRDVLRDSRYWVDGMGYLPEEEFQKIASIFGQREGGLGSMLAIYSTFAAAGSESNDGDENEPSPTAQDSKQRMLELIDEELKKLEGIAKETAEREQLELDATILSRHLPDGGAIETFARYETANDRRMYKALTELTSLQAARRLGRTGERPQ